MKNIILSVFLTSILGCLIALRVVDVSNELQNLNSKIDKIVIFLDLDLNAEDEVAE